MVQRVVAPRPATRRSAAARVVGAFVAALVGMLAAGCGASDDIRTVADFDANPCALFTDASISDTVGAPYVDIEEAPPVLRSSREADDGGARSCVYAFDVPQPRLTQMSSFTVTVSHLDGASQPLAICAAGANTKNPGYTLQEFADLACTTPSSDLWMRIGERFFHVVVVAQPGFDDPVARSVAISPVLLVVGRATADRMPKK